MGGWRWEWWQLFFFLFLKDVGVDEFKTGERKAEKKAAEKKIPLILQYHLRLTMYFTDYIPKVCVGTLQIICKSIHVKEGGKKKTQTIH